MTGMANDTAGRDGSAALPFGAAPFTLPFSWMDMGPADAEALGGVGAAISRLS